MLYREEHEEHLQNPKRRRKVLIDAEKEQELNKVRHEVRREI